MNPIARIPSAQALAALWQAAQLPAQALSHMTLTGDDPVLPSSFPVGTAVQTGVAAAALAAAELWHHRTGAPRQDVSVDMTHAALDSAGWFSLDGVVPEVWDKLSGLYACGAESEPGHVRIHANFAHHRDIALGVLGLQTGAATERSSVEQALRRWRAEDFETAVTEAGGVAAAARSFDAWDKHPQGQALRASLTGGSPVRIERIDGDNSGPRAWAGVPASARPLHGLRVLDLTRILAGPVAGRTLAGYGAEVMLINSPKLPNIEAIADTSRGKLSAHVDLQTESGRATLRTLLSDAHVLLQGYRPGALARLGFGAEESVRLRPGLVHVSLSAYGWDGPWAGKRGFDSLVQTATGFNHAEALAAGSPQPKAMPIQVLDYTAGYLLAFGAQAALWRQAREGGSWRVQVSLAGVGSWLRSLGRVDAGFSLTRPSMEPYLEASDSGFGRLVALRHAAQFSQTPAAWPRPSMPPGTHPPEWPPLT
jgi:hypothetical protein